MARGRSLRSVAATGTARSTPGCSHTRQTRPRRCCTVIPSRGSRSPYSGWVGSTTSTHSVGENVRPSGVVSPVGLARPARTADHQVLVPPHPFQGLQRLLGGVRDAGEPGLPGREGLAGWEAGLRLPRGQRRPLPPLQLLLQQQAQHLRRRPALGLRGRQHLGRGAPQVGQPQAPQQALQVVRQRRGLRSTHAGGGAGAHAPNPCQAAVVPCKLCPSLAACSGPGVARAWWTSSRGRSSSPKRSSSAAVASAASTGPRPCS